MTGNAFGRGRACGLLLLAVALLLLVPGSAFAWGPGVHLAAADWLFGNLALLPLAAARCIGAHKDAFLYGSLSADIFIGKGCAVKPGHSHTWETGLNLLDRAVEPRLQAYAYGYLAHLAADIVAHNNYVPSLMSTTPGSGKLSHVYIEAQADRLVRWDSAGALRLFESHHARPADSCLRGVTRAARMPFLLKKHVFKRSMAVAGTAPWRGSLGMCRLVTPDTADPAFFAAMFNASLQAVLQVLSAPMESALCTLDPIGEASLRDARALCCGRAPLAFRKPFPLRFPLHPLVAELPPLPYAASADCTCLAQTG